MSKSILISTLMLIALSVFAAPQLVSCYEAFAQAYDQAEKLKAEEREFCDSYTLGSSLCNQESELSFDTSVNLAADEFDCCVMGC